MKKINVSKKSIKFLDKLPLKQYKQIICRINNLVDNSFPHDSLKLKNSIYYRISIGEYRIIYCVEKENIYISMIGKRNDFDIYKQLNR